MLPDARTLPGVKRCPNGPRWGGRGGGELATMSSVCGRPRPIPHLTMTSVSRVRYVWLGRAVCLESLTPAAQAGMIQLTTDAA
eukprot:364287-Chlamydomonas_euryale.AAC.4